jgi:hypothetical protein
MTEKNNDTNQTHENHNFGCVAGAGTVLRNFKNSVFNHGFNVSSNPTNGSVRLSGLCTAALKSAS